MSHFGVQYEQADLLRKVTRYYTGMDRPLEGQALCYDHDAATAADRRNVETPSISNLTAFAGFVPTAANHSGPRHVDVVPPLCGPVPSVSVRTDQSISAGDLLGPQPGTRDFGKAVFGVIAFKAREAKDGSSTPAMVSGDWGYRPGMELDDENLLIVTHERWEQSGYVKDLGLTGESDPGSYFSQVADTGTWLVTVVDGGGDNGEIVRVRDHATGGRILEVVTNDADNDYLNVQRNGLFYYLGGGAAFYMEFEVAVADADKTDWFVGLAAADTDILGGVTDRIGFEVNASSTAQLIKCMTEKDSTETSTTTGVTVTDGAFFKCAVWSDGKGTVRFYINGALVASHTANIPDDLGLATAFQVRNDGAQVNTLRLKPIVVRNHL
ncbi:MAG: hypothetical protein KIS87_08845 [Phycisphaeraceae bacterium]|nr:hypothetical protein [Phycisphaeraceae bacterium]